MPEPSSSPGPNPQPRSLNLVAAGLLLAALALVVLYTSRRAFLSPVALVVIAAIGVAALFLQLRLRPEISPSMRGCGIWRSLWLNALGVLFAVAALFAEPLHLNGIFVTVAALLAVLCFAVSGIIVLSGLRKRRKDRR